MRLLRSLVLSVIAGVVLGLAAAAPVTSSDAETNRRLLQEFQASDPEQYARLTRNFERFRELLPEQQEKLRNFDRQLHDEDSQTRARLMRVLSEYAAWLTRLPEPDRQRVLAATTSEERLRLIRAIKERQWWEQLPRVRREEWQAAPESKRKELTDSWRRDEQRQRDLWVDARRHADETVEPSLPLAAQEEAARQMKVFLEKRLYPMLSPDERDRLRKADDERLTNPFMMMRTIVDLSEKHPVLALEPRYLTFASLPEPYRQALQSLPRSAQQAVRQFEAQWPRFPVEVTKLLRQQSAAPKQQLGPASAKDFPAHVEEFIERKLKPKLTGTEKERLQRADGRWPEYPLALHELAREHKLVIPELSLPIDPQRLERLKPRRPFATAPLPEPPERMLRDFALTLMREDPDGPRLSLNNASDREVIKKKFFEKHPDMLERLRQQDKAKMDLKKKKS